MERLAERLSKLQIKFISQFYQIVLISFSLALSSCQFQIIVPQGSMNTEKVTHDGGPGIGNDDSADDDGLNDPLEAELIFLEGATYTFSTYVDSESDRTLTLANNGSADAKNLSLSDLAAPFAYKGGSYPGEGGDCTTELSAGKSCGLVITYSPSAVGNHSVTLKAEHDDGEVSIELKGTATLTPLGAITFTEGESYAFEDTMVGTSTDHTFTLTNTGTAALSGLEITGLGGGFDFKDGSFPGAGGDCSATLALDESCEIVLSFTPTAVGAHEKTISAKHDDGSTEIDLKGNGTPAPAAVLAFSDGASFTYPPAAVHSSWDHTLTLTNTGDAEAKNLSFTELSGPFSYKNGDLPGESGTFPGAGGDCGNSLAIGASCKVVLSYTPSAAGSHETTFTVEHGDGSTEIEIKGNASQHPGLSTQAPPGLSGIVPMTGQNLGDALGTQVIGGFDLNKDGTPEYIIVGVGSDEAGFGILYSGANGSPLHTYFGIPGTAQGTYHGPVGDITGDGYPDFIKAQSHWSGLDDNNVNLAERGRLQVISDEDHEEAYYTIYGKEAFEKLGSGAVAAVGDLNNDGVPDFVAAAPNSSQGALNGGRVTIYSGADGAEIKTFTGKAGEEMGYPASAGDLNQDGKQEILIGNPKASAGGTARGEVIIIDGDTLTELTTLSGEKDSAAFGAHVAKAGDVNGDGYPDFLVSEKLDSANSEKARTFVYSGKDFSIIHTIEGQSGTGELIMQGHAIGDLDGDGKDDFAITDRLIDTESKHSGLVHFYSGATGKLFFTISSGEADDGFGVSFTPAGDLNGDGEDDFIVGAPDASKRRGRVHFFFSK